MVEGVKGVFGAGYNFLDSLTGGKLTAIKDKFSEKLSPITGTVGNMLDAAGAAASEKLENMRTAYEQHGGGIQGVAAATMAELRSIDEAGFNILNRLTGGKLDGMKAAYEAHGGGIRGEAAAMVEGVKIVFGAGYSFLDNLTGGKLSEIGGRFSAGMSGMVQSANQKLAETRAAFLGGLNSIRNTVDGVVTWFFDSGRKVVTTFASGIRSAFSSAVDAVRGGLQKIRNLLPFSDAKEGPLSTLTLSGQRTMTTYANGLAMAQDAPVAVMERGLRGANAALEWDPVEKVSVSYCSNDEDSGSAEGTDSGSTGKQIYIKNLVIRMDPKTIKDLQSVFSVIREIEDYADGCGEGPDDEPEFM